ncbi:MAG: hypothetical protein AAB678_03285 [Patescibacteria group bacterium]
MGKETTTSRITFHVCNCEQYPLVHGSFRVSGMNVLPEVFSLWAALQILKELCHTYRFTQQETEQMVTELQGLGFVSQVTDYDRIALEEMRQRQKAEMHGSLNDYRLLGDSHKNN